MTDSSETGVLMNPFKVAILGTGLYGRAIADRIRHFTSLEVAVGSRSPSPTNSTVSHLQAIENAQIIIFAIPASAYTTVIENLKDHISQGATIIDISNRPLSMKFTQDTVSNAVLLKKQVPSHMSIVKAFNTISSYDISPNVSTKDLPVVQIAADSSSAIERVSYLARAMRMIPVHFGGLDSAIELEKASHRLFPLWKVPITISLIIWTWWILYSTLSTYVIHGSRGTPSRPWMYYPLGMVMATTGETAMTCFALTYLAGPVAILMQLTRKSTSKPFGKFMGTWLGIRKELGIIAFAFVSTHGIAGAISASHLEDGWKGQIYFVFGIFSFVLFAILAVSSNKSVAEGMSWAEFQMVFSWIGISGLILGIIHQGFWGGIILQHIPDPSFWVGGGSIMPIYWVGIILPIITVLLRFITWSPCVVLPIRKLKGESNAEVSIENM